VQDAIAEVQTVITKEKSGEIRPNRKPAWDVIVVNLRVNRCGSRLERAASTRGAPQGPT